MKITNKSKYKLIPILLQIFQYLKKIKRLTSTYLSEKLQLATFKRPSAA